MSVRMTTLQEGERVSTGSGSLGEVVHVDRSGATEWCVYVRLDAGERLIVGYRPSDLVVAS